MNKKPLSGCLLVFLLACMLSAAVNGAIFARNNLALANVTLESGDVVHGNLFIFGHNGIVGDGARITGSLVVIGGNVILGGDIGGNLVVVGGNATIQDEDRVGGSVISVGS